MNATTQLVLTHGTSDLQILLRDEHDRLWRAVPDKANVRRFHEWLLALPSETVTVVDLPPALAGRDAEATFTDWMEDTFGLWIGATQQIPDPTPQRDAQGRIQLVLPKIGPALSRWMHAGPESSSSSLASVLVLSTDRSDTQWSAQEPVATPVFLTHWLAQHGVQAVQEVVFLSGNERLESADSPISSLVVQRLEKAMFDFYDRQAKATLLIASMGGLPPVKPLLSELAVMLAGDKAMNLFKTEDGPAGLLSRHPADAVRVRRQCRELVHRGALLDASAQASVFAQDPQARTWVTPLLQAAALLNGNPVQNQQAQPALREVLKQTKHAQCLLVAIRVETALLNERWLEAINGSVIFLEAAFHDIINRWADNHLKEYDSRQRKMVFFNDSPPPSTLLDLRNGKPALEPWYGNRPLTYKANFVGENALAAWSEVLDVPELDKLRHVMHAKRPMANGGQFRLADYRNFNTHGVMTQDEIDQAVSRFMGANVWSQGVNTTPANKPKPGKCFIARPVVTAMLTHLMNDAVAPLALYQALLDELDEALIAPPAQALP